MKEGDSGLALACSLTVLVLVSSSLVWLNMIQMISLGPLVSPVVWVKALTCAFPLSCSVFLLVPLLSSPLAVHKSRLAMLASLVRRPSALITIAASGAALHYFLPVLNPIVNVDVNESPLTAYLTCSGLSSGVSFYLALMYKESSVLNYPTFRIGWQRRLVLSFWQMLASSFSAAQQSFKTFFIIWLCVTFTLSLPVWPLLAPLFQAKIFMLFCFSQFLLSLCLATAQSLATNPRFYQMETAVVGEESIVQIIKSKDSFKRRSGLQELALLSRYPDPRRSQIFQLSVPGGKPRTWDAIWVECAAILNDFVKKMETINQPESKTQQSKTDQQTKVTPQQLGDSKPSENTNVRNRFGDLHLWSKSSSVHSPQRTNSTTTTVTETKVNAQSLFLDKKDNTETGLVWRLIGGVLAMVAALANGLVSKLKLPFSFSLGSIRPINYLIAEREEYKMLCLVAEVNCVRLAVIALSNIFAAAPEEDTYGVTQLGLKSALGLFNRLVKGLDIIVRNNQKRSELRKLRNEVKTALGKVTSAYGDSLKEL